MMKNWKDSAKLNHKRNVAGPSLDGKVVRTYRKGVIPRRKSIYSKDYCCCCSVAQPCPTFYDPMDCMQPTMLLCSWHSPRENTGVGRHSLPQGIFPTQGSNPGLLQCRRILHHLSHQESPAKSAYLSTITLNCQWTKWSDQRT